MCPVEITAEVDRIAIGVHIFQLVKEIKTVGVFRLKPSRFFGGVHPGGHIVAGRSLLHLLNQTFLPFLNFLHSRGIGKLRAFGMGDFVVHRRCGGVNAGYQRPQHIVNDEILVGNKTVADIRIAVFAPDQPGIGIVHRALDNMRMALQFLLHIRRRRNAAPNRAVRNTVRLMAALPFLLHFGMYRIQCQRRSPEKLRFLVFQVQRRLKVAGLQKMLKILTMRREYGFSLLTVLKHRLQPVLQIADIFFAYVLLMLCAEKLFRKLNPHPVQRIFDNVFDMADTGFFPVTSGINHGVGAVLPPFQNIFYSHCRPLSGCLYIN